MAEELISQGRRHLLCAEITQAIEKFQKACETLSSEFGDLDDRLAEPNLLYGTALLELARMESTVLGNALDGEEDSGSDEEDNKVIEKGPEMTEEEKEDISNQIIDAMCEKDVDNAAGVNETEPETPVMNEVEPSATAEAATEPNAEAADLSENGVEQNDDDNEEDGGVDNEADGEEEDAATDEEDVTNLQLAWEVIEVAKQIFARVDDAEHKSKVADCLEKLAEISREKEDYAQALADFDQCLSIRSEVSSDNLRVIAETHYQIGTTHAVAGDLDKASASFKKSVTCLEDYVKNLKEKINHSKDSGDDAKKLESLQASLTEVEALIPDIERRLTEIDEDRMASVFVPSSSTTKMTESQNSDKVTDDITHLVRKKRQVTEDSGQNDVKDLTVSSDIKSPVTKKTKLSNGHEANETNGSEQTESCNGTQLSA